jgi:hypothetical protein
MKKLKMELPGPGAYDASDYKNGCYVTSQFKNYGTYKYTPLEKSRANRVLRQMNSK